MFFLFITDKVGRQGMHHPTLKVLKYVFVPKWTFKFLQRFYVTMIVKSSLLSLFIVKECGKGKKLLSYLGKLANVGT